MFDMLEIMNAIDKNSSLAFNRPYKSNPANLSSPFLISLQKQSY